MPPYPFPKRAQSAATLACDPSLQATSSVLPISYPSLTHAGLQPGRGTE